MHSTILWWFLYNLFISNIYIFDFCFPKYFVYMRISLIVFIYCLQIEYRYFLYASYIWHDRNLKPTCILFQKSNISKLHVFFSFFYWNIFYKNILRWDLFENLEHLGNLRNMSKTEIKKIKYFVILLLK